jgi:hypothetical protein
VTAHEQNAHIGNTNDRISVKVDVSQHDLDALNALIHWLDALEKYGGHGMIPGHFEFHMMYRSMVHAIRSNNVI